MVTEVAKLLAICSVIAFCTSSRINKRGARPKNKTEAMMKKKILREIFFI